MGFRLVLSTLLAVAAVSSLAAGAAATTPGVVIVGIVKVGHARVLSGRLFQPGDKVACIGNAHHVTVELPAVSARVWSTTDVANNLALTVSRVHTGSYRAACRSVD